MKWIPAVLALICRPWLWSPTLKFVPNKPWRVSSWIAAREYLYFRMETAYGNKHAIPPTKDLVEFLHWCKASQKLRKT